MLSSERIQALVLCAGFGKRLAPLTDIIPKPAIPFFGLPLVSYIIAQLVNAGLKRISFNLHHHSESMRQTVLSCPMNFQAHFSLEEPIILGSGGALGPVLRECLDEGEDLLVVNGDVLSDIPLAALINHHRSTGALATFAVLPELLPGENLGLVYKNGRFFGRGTKQALVPGFQLGGNGCAYVVKRDFLNFIVPGESVDLFELCTRAANHNQALAVFPVPGPLFDLGTPSRIWQTHMRLLNDPMLIQRFRFDQCFRAYKSVYRHWVDKNPNAPAFRAQAFEPSDATDLPVLTYPGPGVVYTNIALGLRETLKPGAQYNSISQDFQRQVTKNLTVSNQWQNAVILNSTSLGGLSSSFVAIEDVIFDLDGEVSISH
jgi:hypothetical protein